MAHQLFLVFHESERKSIALKCSQVSSSQVRLMEKRRNFLLFQSSEKKLDFSAQ